VIGTLGAQALAVHALQTPCNGYGTRAMTDSLFEVAYSGALAPNAEPDRVRAGLAQLFKIDDDRARALFSGRRVVIKRGVDQATAKKYQLAMIRFGAIAEIAPVGAEASPEPTAAPAPTAPVAPPPTAATVPPPSVAADWTIAPPGVDLIEQHEVPDAEIDTSGLTIAEPGVTLIPESGDAPEPEIDISGLSADPPQP
jgi:hypothetical protein